VGGEAEGDEGDEADVEVRLGDGEGCQRQHLGPQPRDGAAPNPPPLTLRCMGTDDGPMPVMADVSRFRPPKGGGRRCRREGMG